MKLLSWMGENGKEHSKISLLVDRSYCLKFLRVLVKCPIHCYLCLVSVLSTFSLQLLWNFNLNFLIKNEKYNILTTYNFVILDLEIQLLGYGTWMIMLLWTVETNLYWGIVFRKAVLKFLATKMWHH